MKRKHSDVNNYDIEKLKNPTRLGSTELTQLHRRGTPSGMAWTEDEFNQGLGKQLRLARTSRKLDQARLAEMVNISRSSLVNIEAGKQGVSAFTLIRIAMVLDLKVTDLLPSELGIRGLLDGVSSQVEGRSVADALRRKVADIVARYQAEKAK